MKKALLLGLSMASVAGCDMLSGLEVSEAYTEVMLQSQEREMMDDMAEASMASGEGERGADGMAMPRDPLAMARDIEAFIDSQADCSEIVREDNVLSVDFGDLDDDCAFMGKTYAGSLSVVTSTTDDGEVISLTFDGMTDGIITLDGIAEIEMSADQRTVSSDVHISRDEDAMLPCERGEESKEDEEQPEQGEMADEMAADRARGEGREDAMGQRPHRMPPPPAEVDIIAERSEAALDGSFDNGVRVNGSRQMIAEMGTATITESNLEIVAGERVPQAGTIVHDGPRGEVTLSFERVDDDTIQVSISGEHGDQTLMVDPTTGAPQ
ncbi:MAG: hypothetical protein AAFV53_25600 [Myxococcota bacterium]